MHDRSSNSTRVLRVLAAAAFALTASLAACGGEDSSRTWTGHLSLFVPQTAPGLPAESFQVFTAEGDPTQYRLIVTSRTERSGGPAHGQRRALNPRYRVTGRLLDAQTIEVDELEYLGAPPRPEVDYQLAEAVEREDLAAVEAALAANANARTLDLLDDVPVLLRACNADIALALLAAGADPKAYTEHGYNLLSIRLNCGGASIVDDVRRLLDAGIEVNPPHAMSSPLNDALIGTGCDRPQDRSPECRPLLRLLLERGATFNAYELENRKGVLEYQLRTIVE